MSSNLIVWGNCVVGVIGEGSEYNTELANVKWTVINMRCEAYIAYYPCFPLYWGGDIPTFVLLIEMDFFFLLIHLIHLFLIICPLLLDYNNILFFY